MLHAPPPQTYWKLLLFSRTSCYLRLINEALGVLLKMIVSYNTGCMSCSVTAQLYVYEVFWLVKETGPAAEHNAFFEQKPWPALSDDTYDSWKVPYFLSAVTVFNCITSFVSIHGSHKYQFCVRILSQVLCLYCSDLHLKFCLSKTVSCQANLTTQLSKLSDCCTAHMRQLAVLLSVVVKSLWL